ncbi:MAG: L-aspartate oxidase [Bacteroidia bacterium]|nr:L-aspartate oxidase [Bacteroidia bacterium]
MNPRPHILVVGSGLAGMYYALKVSSEANVTLVCKNQLFDSNTFWAQGGIASVMKEDDSIEKHIADTIEAGDGLCDLNVVTELLSKAPKVIEQLLHDGFNFTRNADGTLNLSREGGHSEARVVHAQDRTGEYLIKNLTEKIKAHPQITVLENTQVVDLYVNENICTGAWAINKTSNELILIRANLTVLATGGAGGIFKKNTNPAGATGDGYAMAWRAGALLSNMEFVQFHPTMFYSKNGNSFLISETLRGYGAELKLPNGDSFMQHYHKLGSLAPRDIISKAIAEQMQLNHIPCVYLDTTVFSEAELQGKFPYIFGQCIKHGINPSRQMIPVVPAAHYFCGGILADTSGKTSIPGLAVIGESACTGLHGANRLASNSLLEALVMADNCSKQTLQYLVDLEYTGEKFLNIAPVNLVSDEQIQKITNPAELQNMMWHFCGIIRTESLLKLFKNILPEQIKEVKNNIREYGLLPALIEQMNRLQTAFLVTDAAWKRKESRGCHLYKNYPLKLSAGAKSISIPYDGEQLIHIFEETIPQK